MISIDEIKDVSIQYPGDKTLTGKLQIWNLGVSLLFFPRILSDYESNIILFIYSDFKLKFLLVCFFPFPANTWPQSLF